MNLFSNTLPKSLHDFWQGLTRPSGLAVGVAASIVVAFFAVSFGMARDFVTSDSAGYLARSEYDHHLFVTREIARLGTSADTRPMVVIIGASVTLASFGPAPEIEAKIAETTGVDVEVFLLATSRQSILEHRAIVDQVLGTRPVHVVIGLGPSRFSRTQTEIAELIQHTELGFRSAIFDQEARELGLPAPSDTGIYAFDNRKFLLSRQPALLGNILRLRRNERDFDGYIDVRLDDEAFVRLNQNVMTRFDNFEESFPINLSILDRLAADIAAHPEAHLYLMEHPMNPIFVQDYLTTAFYEDYLTEMRQWTAERDIPYWSLAEEGQLEQDDYFDWAHIRTDAARVRMRAVLAQRLEISP